MLPYKANKFLRINIIMQKHTKESCKNLKIMFYITTLSMVDDIYLNDMPNINLGNTILYVLIMPPYKQSVQKES